jgi:hypothetical protein
MQSRKLQFRFCFPPIYGIFDTGEGLIYVFGEQDGKIEDVLSHEVLHWTVQKIAEKRASLDLDNIPPKFLRVHRSHRRERMKTN